MSLRWIDTHCHLDALEFQDKNWPATLEVRAQAAIKGVAHCVIPAVEVANFDAVRTLAHVLGDSYCLGIHPLYVECATQNDLTVLEAKLDLYRDDPRLVGVGEIGLDFFVPALREGALRGKQEFFFKEQLKLARRFNLPVVLHVRRAVDTVLKHVRGVAAAGQGSWRWSGIAHAFNGSLQQANALIAQGFKLGFGGAVTYERATQLRALAQNLPPDALVLETDAPDIPPHWLYVTAEQRAQGVQPRRNEPSELPAIAAVLAGLRGIEVHNLAHITAHNACAALPKLAALLV